MTRAGSALLFVLLIGCKSAPDQPAATAPADPPAATGEAGPTDVAQGQVACHLDCSGQERTTYAATEELARAAARQLVDETCRPEDGQFFIVCEPAPAE